MSAVQPLVYDTTIGQEDVIYLKDAGHIPHIEAPEAFMASVLSLLEEMSAP